jgi:hypothetical protein
VTYDQAQLSVSPQPLVKVLKWLPRCTLLVQKTKDRKKHWLQGICIIDIAVVGPR